MKRKNTRWRGRAHSPFNDGFEAQPVKATRHQFLGLALTNRTSHTTR